MYGNGLVGRSLIGYEEVRTLMSDLRVGPHLERGGVKIRHELEGNLVPWLGGQVRLLEAGQGICVGGDDTWKSYLGGWGVTAGREPEGAGPLTAGHTSPRGRLEG